MRNIEWLLVSLRGRYRGGVTLRAELVADGVPYRMLLTKTNAEISRGDLPSPDLAIRGTGAAIASLFVERKPGGKLPPGVTVDGGSQSLKTLLAAFSTSEIEAAIAAS
jgi:hypothetical protein